MTNIYSTSGQALARTRCLVLPGAYELLQLLHLLGASLWLGFIIVFAASPLMDSIKARRSEPAIIYLRIGGWPSTLGLLLAIGTGTAMGYLRGFNSVVAAKILLGMALLLVGIYSHEAIKKKPIRIEEPPAAWFVSVMAITVAISVALAVLGWLLRFQA